MVFDYFLREKNKFIFQILTFVVIDIFSWEQ